MWIQGMAEQGSHKRGPGLIQARKYWTVALHFLAFYGISRQQLITMSVGITV